MRYALFKALMLLSFVIFTHEAVALVSAQGGQAQQHEVERIACLRGCLTKCKQEDPLISCQECQFMCIPRARINKKIIPVQSLAPAKPSIQSLTENAS